MKPLTTHHSPITNHQLATAAHVDRGEPGPTRAGVDECSPASFRPAANPTAGVFRVHQTKPPSQSLKAPIAQKYAFKHGEMLRFQYALVWRGLELMANGIHVFSSDDLPEDRMPGDNTTAGLAIEALRCAHVIERSYFHWPERGIIYGRRKSKHAARKGSKINLWQLTSRAMAETWLRENELPFEPAQRELEMRIQP